MSAESEVGQRGHNCAQIHNINMQFLNTRWFKYDRD